MPAIDVATGERFDPDGRGGIRHVRLVTVTVNGVRFHTEATDEAQAFRLCVETARALGVK